MESLKQFESYFTKLCCVHLKEPIPLCQQKPGAEPRGSAFIRVMDGKAVAVDEHGMPSKSPPAVVTLPIEIQQDNEQRPIFALVVENCVVLPSPSMDRVILGYHVGDCLMEVSVRPDDIVSITTVAKGNVPPDKKIITS